MKIDEPKTPFNYLDADDEEAGASVGEAEGTLSTRFAFGSGSDDDERMVPRPEPHRRGSYTDEKGPGLAAVDVESLASEALRRREAEWESSEGDDFMTYKERKLEQQRQADFEEKRKQHYNMGSLLKRQKPIDEDDDED